MLIDLLEQTAGNRDVDLLGRAEESLHRHIDDSPRPTLVFTICLPVAHWLWTRHRLAILGQQIAVSFNGLADVVEGLFPQYHRR
jgi:hypothetical protein